MSDITTKILVVGLALLVGSFAHAVEVGPLDGKDVPGLKPLGQPAFIASESLPDYTFPKELEERGDLTSAALEWQRIAHKTYGQERVLPLSNAIRLQLEMNNPQVAAALVEELQMVNATTPYVPEALYRLVASHDVFVASKALSQLQNMYPASPWTQAAQLQNVWQQAKATGHVRATYNLPQAHELKQRILAIRKAQRQKEALAGAAGVLAPGVGHMLAGNVPQGIAVLLLWCLFTLAFLSACRHRHYAYAFLFVIPAVSLWMTGPLVAMKLVQDQTHAKIEDSLSKWTDLLPTEPASSLSTPAQM